MIVCSCMRITDRDIRAAIAWMRAADPDTLITPGKVYRVLGKAPDCGGCIRLFVAQMRASRELAVPGAPASAADDVPAELRRLRARAAEEA